MADETQDNATSVSTDAAPQITPEQLELIKQRNAQPTQFEKENDNWLGRFVQNVSSPFSAALQGSGPVAPSAKAAGARNFNPTVPTAPQPADTSKTVPLSAKAASVVQPPPNPDQSTTMSASHPDWTNRFVSMFTAGVPALNPDFEVASHTNNGVLSDGTTPKMQLITPEAAMTSQEKRDNPVTAAIAETTGSFTDPVSTAIIAGTMGLGEIPAIGKLAPALEKVMPTLAQATVPKLVAAGFSAQQLLGAYQMQPEIKKAMDAGDYQTAQQLMIKQGIGAGMGLLAGAHAAAGAPSPLGDLVKRESVSEMPDMHEAMADSPVSLEKFGGRRILDHRGNEPSSPFSPEEAKDLREFTGKPLESEADLIEARKSKAEFDVNQALSKGAVDTDPKKAVGSKNRNVTPISLEKFGGKTIVEGGRGTEPSQAMHPDEAAELQAGSVKPLDTEEERIAARKSNLERKSVDALAAGKVDTEAKNVVGSKQAKTDETPMRDMQSVAEKAGIKYLGDIAKDDPEFATATFQDPVSGSSVAIRVKDFTPEKLQAKLEKARAEATPDKLSDLAKSGMAADKEKDLSEKELEPETAMKSDYSVPKNPLKKMALDPSGRTELETMNHELGHVFGSHLNGIGSRDVVSDSHPVLQRSNARAAAMIKLRPFRDQVTKEFTPESVGEHLPKIMESYMGGIAADELHNNIPRGQGFGAADMRESHALLKNLGMSDDEAHEITNSAIDRVKSKLDHPVTRGMIKENAPFREDNLANTHHISEERLTAMKAEHDRRMAEYEKNNGQDPTAGNEGIGLGGAKLESGAKESAGGSAAGGVPQEEALKDVPSDSRDQEIEEVRKYNETRDARKAERLHDMANEFDKAFDPKNFEPLKDSPARPSVGKDFGKIDSWEISDKRPSGPRGWLSGDGKNYVSVPTEAEHEDIAGVLTGDKRGKGGMSSEKLFNDGWIRKAAHGDYEVTKLTPKNVEIIEKDAIQTGRAKKPLMLVQEGPFHSGQHFYIKEGWTDLRSEIAKQLAAEKSHHEQALQRISEGATKVAPPPTQSSAFYKHSE